MFTILFDFCPKSDLFGKKGLRMVWFSTIKENSCSVTTETQNPLDLYMLIELLFTFKVPPRKWQLRVYNSCVLKSGTKMRLLSNSPTGDRSQRGHHLCIHKLKIFRPKQYNFGSCTFVTEFAKINTICACTMAESGKR